jgi:C-terminal processing protease CtpA/Prc
MKDLARFGVGLLLRKSEDGTFQVARVAEGGAAYKDGRIKAGDILTAINGIPTNSKRLRDIGEELTGPLGSELWLSLLHSDQLQPDIKFETHIVLHRGPISPNIEEARMPPQPTVAKLSRSQRSKLKHYNF